MSDPDQARDALNTYANPVRFHRALVRRRIRRTGDYRQSREQIARVLIDPVHPMLRGLSAHTLLGWAYKIHPAMPARMLNIAGASAYATVGALTPRQRLVLRTILTGDQQTLLDAEQAARLDLQIQRRRRRASGPGGSIGA